MDNAVFYTVWLLLHDLEFAKRHTSLPFSLFPSGGLRALAALAIDQALNYRRTTTLYVLDVALDQVFEPEHYGSSEEEVRRMYHDLNDAFYVTDETRGRVIMVCEAWARQRQMGAALAEGAEALQKGDEEAASLAILQARKVTAVDEEPLRLDRDIQQALGPLSEDGVATGFPYLDRVWHGGPRPGEFGVVLASTNIGKTQTLCYMAASAFKKNHRVLYYTFELHQKQVLRRIAAAVLQRPAGQVPIDEANDLLAQVRLQRELDVSFIEIRMGTKTVADLLMDIEEMETEHEKPDIILLDSADDLVAVGKHQSEYTRAGEIYRDLRKLSLATETVIWTSTQATREAIDKARISLKHMGDSFWKARRAHFVLGFSQTRSQIEADPINGGLMSVYILKDSQHGTPGRWFDVAPTFGPARPDEEGYPGFNEVRDLT